MLLGEKLHASCSQPFTHSRLFLFPQVPCGLIASSCPEGSTLLLQVSRQAPLSHHLWDPVLGPISLPSWGSTSQDAALRSFGNSSLFPLPMPPERLLSGHLSSTPTNRAELASACNACQAQSFPHQHPYCPPRLISLPWCPYCFW